MTFSLRFLEDFSQNKGEHAYLVITKFISYDPFTPFEHKSAVLLPAA